MGFKEFCGGQFWNTSLLLDGSWPQFTECFLHTIVIWVPSGFLLLSAPFYFYYLYHNNSNSAIPINVFNSIKSLLLCLFGVFSLLNIIEDIRYTSYIEAVPVAIYVGHTIKLISYCVALGILHYERIHGVGSSAILFVYWLLAILFDIIPFYTYIELWSQGSNTLIVILFYTSFLLKIVILGLTCITDRDINSRGAEYASLETTCPEVHASFPAKLLFTWMFKLVLTGYRKGLDESDLWDLNPRDMSSRIVPAFEKQWKQEVLTTQKQNCLEDDKKILFVNGVQDENHINEKSPLLFPNQLYSYTESKSSSENYIFKSERQPKQKNPSLMKVLTKIHIGGLSISFITKFISDICTFVSPMVLSEIIAYMGNREALHPWRGYILVVGLLFANLVRAIFFQISMHLVTIIGMQMKSVLINIIYRKALTMNTEARRLRTTGEVVNLMSVDCNKIQDLLNYLAFLWSTPFQIMLSLILLYYTIGPSVFTGVVVLLLMIPFNSYFAGKQQTYQRENLKIKDKRIKWMTEILNGIKVLKLYGWELSFKDKVERIRAGEIRTLMSVAYTYLVLSLSWALAPFLVTLATFATYILIDERNVLDAQKAFVTLSLFSLLRVPLNLLGIIINASVQACVSLKRINSFLVQPDLDPSNSVQDPKAEFAISIKEGDFKWQDDMPTTLHNINIYIAAGKLVTVVGPVGCGKSSLISAILGEMERVHGTVTLKGKIAYVSQQAWIQNDTVRGNILFGKQYNATKYNAALEACALKSDLSILSGGDMTEIGEKGINLSGGQKQRISLARAVYSDADIFLFDDPLSAVDSHVGKHIFKKVIGPFGCLKRKTRILVTHGVHWLPMVDNILVMADGRIRERGTYTDLLRENAEFAQFLKNYLVEGVAFESEDDQEPDVEIEEMRERMWDKIEFLTSDGAQSGDDNPVTERKQKRKRTSSTRSNSSRMSLSLSKSDSHLGLGHDDNLEKAKGKLTEIESTGHGRIPMYVFVEYFKAAGPIGLSIGILLFVFFQAANIGSNYWLTYWTEDPQLNNQSYLNTTEFVDRNHVFLTVYGLFGVVQVITVLLHSIMYWTRLVNAAKVMHTRIMDKIFRAPMSFLDTTPIGRIMNRVSRDIDTVDSLLPTTIKMWLSTFLIVSSTIIVISITSPVFIAVMIPLGAFYYFIQEFYIPTSRQLKRIESVTRSPIYNHFSETLSGASTIRAYGVTESSISKVKDLVDKNQVFYFAGVASNRWLGVNLDIVATLVVFSASILAVSSEDTGAGTAGLSISYALQIGSAVSWMVRQMSDLETNIVSVERVLEYTKIESEAELVIPSNRPHRNWPNHGAITFRNYQTRYRPGLDLVLRGVSCDIIGGEKIGIVGRTGAGKSSVFLALFRIIEASFGEIIIDGINISEIGLHDLRSKLTILPQDPVLFSGSLRMNLDPFDEFTDDQIWKSLEQSHLKQFVEGLPETIYYECGEGGCNFSVGQRQLVCLARTLLRRTKILVLDEATAAVDYETDFLIQNTIREAFIDCTIITIAHRLNTILDYDRVIVMDEGKIVEFDKPSILLTDKSSKFYSMAREAGLTS